ncbi:hypothetical protein [Gemmiger sp.]|uniref:hypothetical protein n=1 Tax=Gemmiger sp. TaxID=2049027 RepID=UPI003F0B7486
MEQLNIDTGVRSYAINGGPEQGGGILRFNPGDPNVYSRFLELGPKLEELERRVAEEGRAMPEEDGEAALRLLSRADRSAKAMLAEVFGPGNDFDVILGGANLMAVASNGERVITNLFAALQPILEQGARSCAEQRAEAAVEQADARRAARGDGE